jgi:hypothetical protein
MIRLLTKKTRDLGRTPLFLFMLCDVFNRSKDTKLLNTLGETSRTFVEDTILEKYDEVKVTTT